MYNFHRELNDDEEMEFRHWARDNYVAGKPVDPGWHPIIREECERINLQSALEESPEWY